MRRFCSLYVIYIVNLENFLRGGTDNLTTANNWELTLTEYCTNILLSAGCHAAGQYRWKTIRSVKVSEQREYRGQGHHRESASVEVDMERFREWVCETQVENSEAVSRLSRTSALKRRISDVSPVSVMCRYLNWWRVFSDWKIPIFCAYKQSQKRHESIRHACM